MSLLCRHPYSSPAAVLNPLCIQEVNTPSIRPMYLHPNKDGRNDVFYPVLNNDSIIITGFFIKTMSDTIIYFRDRLFYENIENEAWSGMVFENVFFPELTRKEYAGQFKYEYAIEYPDGNIEMVANTGCVIRCGSDAAVIKTKSGCYFPNQIINNVFDGSIDANEGDCLK
jgi:hypothetical protein